MAVLQNLAALDPIVRRPVPSLLAPLRRPIFRNRLIATFVSNTGGWMQATAAAWLMASLTPSPLLVALMQTATSLPVLLLALLAGAMADLFDRRHLLMLWTCWMLVTMLALSCVTFFGLVQPWILLLGTFLLGVGTAMNGPTWQAIVQELVPREELGTAVSLNAAGFNLARAIGPAAGGFLLASCAALKNGAALVFLLDAMAFAGVLWILWTWQRAVQRPSALPAERLVASLRAGVRYARFSPGLSSILIRAATLTVGTSALWALLPIVARTHMGSGAAGYGFLTGCVGLGALTAAVLLPRIRERTDNETIVAAAVATLAVALAILAWAPRNAPVIVALFCTGIAWTSIASCLNLAVQLAVPSWVQARTLGLYQMVFVGGTALGSLLWGAVAEAWGAPLALTSAAVALMLGLVAFRNTPLATEADADHTPASTTGSLAQSSPQLVIEPQLHEGPVLVTVDFRIDPARRGEFLTAIHDLRTIRLRSGASRWGIFRDPTDQAHYQELFLVDSWLEHLRLEERLTVSERARRDAAWNFHQDMLPPPQHFFIYACSAAAGEACTA